MATLSDKIDGIYEKIQKVEITVARIDERFDATIPYLATREDISKAITVHKKNCNRTDKNRKKRLPLFSAIVVVVSSILYAIAKALDLPIVP